LAAAAAKTTTVPAFGICDATTIIIFGGDNDE